MLELSTGQEKAWRAGGGSSSRRNPTQRSTPPLCQPHQMTSHRITRRRQGRKGTKHRPTCINKQPSKKENLQDGIYWNFLWENNYTKCNFYEVYIKRCRERRRGGGSRRNPTYPTNHTRKQIEKNKFGVHEKQSVHSAQRASNKNTRFVEQKTAHLTNQ